jgi:hypothetical protein
VTDRPVLSETVLRSMSGCLMHESAIVGCEPCDYLMTQGRAVESAVLRELAQGAGVTDAYDSIMHFLYGQRGCNSPVIADGVRAALTRAIAGERAKASAREAMWDELDELLSDSQTISVERSLRIAALRAQLLGAPDGR